MSAFHDAHAGSIERGNVLGDRSTVRQSKYFRQYESGNDVKSLLGTDNLRWDVNKKEGVFAGHSVYDGHVQDYKPVPAQYGLADEAPQAAAPRFGRRADPTASTVPPPPAAPATKVVHRGGVGRSSMDWHADALWQAVGSRNLAEVTRLLRQGADPNVSRLSRAQAACSRAHMAFNVVCFCLRASRAERASREGGASALPNAGTGSATEAGAVDV